ncbi:MAG: hypothetical protein IJV39_05215 [Ruminococcus sp.]|nr:hypothetical protein [Ruminococcus sp.]
MKKLKICRSVGEKMISGFQYYDPDKGKKGLLDENPAPIVLKIFVENGNVKFEQTEYTSKYLGVVS